MSDALRIEKGIAFVYEERPDELLGRLTHIPTDGLSVKDIRQAAIRMLEEDWYD